MRFTMACSSSLRLPAAFPQPRAPAYARGITTNTNQLSGLLPASATFLRKWRRRPVGLPTQRPKPLRAPPKGEGAKDPAVGACGRISALGRLRDASVAGFRLWVGSNRRFWRPQPSQSRYSAIYLPCSLPKADISPLWSSPPAPKARNAVTTHHRAHLQSRNPAARTRGGHINNDGPGVYERMKRYFAPSSSTIRYDPVA